MADEGLIDRLRAAFAPQDTQSYAYDPTGYSAPSATPSFLNRYMPAGMFTGDPEAQASADASQAMSPVVSPYLAKVLSGAMSGDSLKEGLQSVNDAFANHDYPALAGMFAGGGAGIKAYHGSPYDFNAFDASKIGTGEGAQAYGHGLYFAESEPVARSYRDTFASQGSPTVGDSQFRATDPKHLASYYLHEANGDRELARTLIDNDAKGSPFGGPYGFVKRLLDSGETFPEYAPAPPGRMYEVNIDADPEQFLHWDKPLSGQASQTRGAILDLLQPQERARLERWQPPGWSDQPATARYEDVVKGGTIYDKMATQAASNQGRVGYDYPGASEALSQAGIPGIRYLDQGSRGAGDGTSNYVVFDPRIIQILKKYGLAGFLPSAGLAAGTGNDQ